MMRVIVDKKDLFSIQLSSFILISLILKSQFQNKQNLEIIFWTTSLQLEDYIL